MSGFMSLYTLHGHWARVEECGESTLIPAAHVLASQVVSETLTGWCARYSANGYMDCTDWCGPYATEEEAIAECKAVFGDDEGEDECDL